MSEEKLECGSEAMGFKDKEKALYTLKYLKDRDITYQFRAIQNYYIRAKKILRITKNEAKVKNITEAMEVFTEWMDDYRKNDRGRTNLPYLSIEIIEAFRPSAISYGIFSDDFYIKYKEVNGNHTALRTTKTDDGSTTWDIERNKRLKAMINSNDRKNDIEWYETEDKARIGFPTKEHLRFILLGYSPEPSKLRALIPKVTNNQSESPVGGDNKMEVVESKMVDDSKRSHENSSTKGSEIDEELEEPSKKKSKKSPEPANKEVQQESGLSFKDKVKAMKSIESLEGRDVSYQYHALSGLIKRAARVISITKDMEKIKNMKEAVEVFENWITDYNANHRSKENFGYLPLDIVQSYRPLAKEYGVSVPEFVVAYEQVKGDYKKLRTAIIPSGHTTWDIERNKKLRPIVENIKEKRILWFETDLGNLRGLPTKEHTECIMWGFSVEPAKLKKILPQLKEKLNSVD